MEEEIVRNSLFTQALKSKVASWVSITHIHNCGKHRKHTEWLLDKSDVIPTFYSQLQAFFL